MCPYKVTGWGIMFNCGMTLWYAGTLKHSLGLYQLQQTWQPLWYIAINCW